MTNKKQFTNLREYKQYHHLTVPQLAEKLFVDRNWIYKLTAKGNKYIPGTSLIKRIYEVCDIPLYNLLYPTETKVWIDEFDLAQDKGSTDKNCGGEK